MGAQPFGTSAPHWNKKSCLGPHSKYIVVCNHKKSLNSFVLGYIHSHPGLPAVLDTPGVVLNLVYQNHLAAFFFFFNFIISHPNLLNLDIMGWNFGICIIFESHTGDSDVKTMVDHHFSCV